MPVGGILPGNEVVVYDYLQGVLPGDHAFTRASSASVFNSSGSSVTVLSNAPRFDFYPTTLQPRGLLMEPARTNLVLNSATLSTQSVTVTAVAHTLSFYGTGTVTLSGASTAGPLVGTGAFPNRVSLTFTPSAGSLTLTVTGSVTFAQLEVGAFASSYIPTTSAVATRAEDSAIISNLANIGFNPSEGTILAEFELMNTALTLQEVWSIGSGSSDFMRLLNSSATDAQFNIRTGGVNQCFVTNSGLAAGTVMRHAAAYKLDDCAASLNGGTVATDTTVTLPSVSSMRLGRSFIGAGIPMFGWLRRLLYYPTRLPNATLQSLSA